MVIFKAMNRRLFFVLILTMLSVGCAKANSYKANLTTKVSAKSTGMGMVYADTVASGAFEPDSSYITVSKNNGGELVTFYAFAKTNDDTVYGFAGWSETDGGNIISTDNPYKVDLATSSDAVVINSYTLYANFFEKKYSTITFVAPVNGSYTATDGEKTITDSGTMSTAEKIIFTATPADGYKVECWYAEDSEGKRTYFSYDQLCEWSFTSDVKVGVEFVKSDQPVFIIKGSDIPYLDLAEANNAASEGDVIILESSGTLEKGDYTIKKDVTLLIPFDQYNTCYDEVNRPHCFTTYTLPSPYKTLTMLNGSNLSVEGNMCVVADMYSVDSASKYPGGAVIGDYGHVEMESGSTITFAGGSKFYAWGYITGQGKIDVQSGAYVYESFQMPEFRGGTILNEMVSVDNVIYRVFPINQYFVQNVEVPMTLHYGAVEQVISSIYADKTIVSVEPFTFIGEDGFLILSEDTKVTKCYDPETDYQKYVVDGDASLGNINFEMKGTIVNSELYVLPLTNNLDIELKSGTLSVDKSNGAALLPGAKLTVGADAKLQIVNSQMYAYDSDEWGQYAGDYHKSAPRTFTSVYSPTKRFERTTLDDAKVDIQGVVETNNGILYTTKSGANVCCSSGQGHYVVDYPEIDYYTYQATQNVFDLQYVAIEVTPARLKNAIEEEQYVPTDGATSGTTYYFHQESGDWTTSEIPTEINDLYDTKQTISVYDLNGCRRTNLSAGINIVRMADGTVSKVFMK